MANCEDQHRYWDFLNSFLTIKEESVDINVVAARMKKVMKQA